MDQIWWRILLREVVTQRSRTALTVLSIAVGLFAISLTFRTHAILSQNVLDRYAATTPPAIIVQVAPADQQITATLRRVAGVYAVEGVSHISARARIGSTWRALALRGLDDITASQVNQVAPDSGAWPAGRRSMLMERSYLGGDVAVGATLPVELENGQQYQMVVDGTTHDLGVVSGRLGSPVLQASITMSTAEWLTGSRAVNELLIAVAPGQRDMAEIQAVAEEVRATLKQADVTVLGLTTRDPGTPDVYVLLTAVFQTLNVLGGLSLALSTFLVVNTTTAMMARHVAQIGVMKAFGARSAQIFGIYLGMVLLIALIAMLIALPLGALCAWLLATQLAWLMNYDILEVSIPLYVLVIEFVAGIVTPLLVSAYPIGVAARVTVRVALGGLQAATSGSSKPTASIPGVPLTVLYAGRSMFRRKARLALTLAALACGGAIVITVVSAQASLSATLDQVAAYWQQDLTVTFNQPERAARVLGEITQVPGVVSVETQPAILAVRQREDGSESQDRYAIFGVTTGSPLLQPTVIQGRWLAPGTQNEIVVNVDFMKHEPSLQLGDQVRLKANGRVATWTIVGVTTTHLLIYNDSTIDQGVGYVDDTAFMQAIYQAQRTNRIIVTTAQHDASTRGQVGRAIEAHFAQFGIQALVQTEGEMRGQINNFVSLIVVLLLVMALSFVAIGALSLVGAMSLNVMERTKEIGVLRAIGSSHQQVASIVVIEGTCIGLLSWVPATLLAVPLSKILSDVLGLSIVRWPLVYEFPLFAPLLWFAIVVILAAAASYLPARHAGRINVRSALEYE